jgi:hypothetical protein
MACVGALGCAEERLERRRREGSRRLAMRSALW